MIALSIVLGIIIPIAALVTIPIALIIKNLAVCWWRAVPRNWLDNRKENKKWMIEK